MTTTTARYEQRRARKDTEKHLKKIAERRAPQDVFDLMYNLVMNLTLNRQVIIPSKNNGDYIYLPQDEVHEARLSTYKRLLYKIGQERSTMSPEKKRQPIIRY